MSTIRAIVILGLWSAAAGCSDLAGPSQSNAPAKPKTTTDIGEFDPAADNDVVSDQVKISNPITGALEAYQPLKRKIAGLGIDHAVGLFHAL